MYFFVMDHAILFVRSIGYEILGRIIYCYYKIHFSNSKLFGWYAMLNGSNMDSYLNFYHMETWSRRISNFT